LRSLEDRVSERVQALPPALRAAFRELGPGTPSEEAAAAAAIKHGVDDEALHALCGRVLEDGNWTNLPDDSTIEALSAPVREAWALGRLLRAVTPSRPFF
jgi:hypothetical protein